MTWYCFFERAPSKVANIHTFCTYQVILKACLFSIIQIEWAVILSFRNKRLFTTILLSWVVYSNASSVRSKSCIFGCFPPKTSSFFSHSSHLVTDCNVCMSDQPESETHTLLNQIMYLRYSCSLLVVWSSGPMSCIIPCLCCKEKISQRDCLQ